MKAIQIIGTQRSGSNLLRLMLHQLPEIVAPHPPHILRNFKPLLPIYGDLKNPSNFDTLIDDVIQLVERNPVPWKHVKLKREEIANCCRQPLLEEIFRVIYNLKATTFQARFWCCKSTFNLNYISDLEKSGLKPFYIYLYRDGRDVALSFQHAIVGDKHIYHLAKRWRAEQKQALDLYERMGDGRIIKIGYEQLIQHPSQTLRSICFQIGIPFDEGVLDFYNSEESKITARSGDMWKNVARPVIKDNHGMFRSGMSQEDLALFEAIAGEYLEKLGYERLAAITEIDLSPERIKEFDRRNEQLRVSYIKKAGKKEKQKRYAQKKLLQEIKLRPFKID
ncbi:MAG: sulfotransferase family protein [Cyclobacteriaceae bacterium]